MIDNAQEIMVVTADRREWPATVLLDDPRADLAVLKIDAKGEALPTIAIDDTAQPQVGDLVLAIGDPFGVGQTVTNGIVSALARSDVGISDYSFFIQTDASINPGNSGGPLVDMDGDLIGVNTAILSGSGSSAGVGFAIPAAMAKQVVNTALGGGKSVIRPWIGVRTQALTGEMAKSLGLDAPRGVVVTDLWPTGPAARAGVVAGRRHRLDRRHRRSITTPASTTASAPARPARRVALVVRRNGGPPRTLSARTEAPPGATAGGRAGDLRPQPPGRRPPSSTPRRRPPTSTASTRSPAAASWSSSWTPATARPSACSPAISSVRSTA